MDMNKIGIVLNEMYKYKNYKDFVNLLSFEERMYIFNDLLNIADNYSLFSDDEVLYNFFKEEEVNTLYEHISELDDLQKAVLGMNAHENLKKEIIKQINDTYTKAELILSLENDDDKLELADSISNEGTKTSIISSLKNPNYKLEYIKKIGLESITFIESLINSIKEDDVLIELLNFINEKSPDSDNLKYEAIKNFSNDELKIKYLNYITNDVYKLYVVQKLNDDIKKIEIIKNIKIDENIELNNALVDVIKSLNSDNLKLENLYLLGNNVYLITRVLTSLKSPELKLKNMHLAKDNAANVMASIDDDDIKIDNLHLLKENYGAVIKSINNPEKRFKLISDNINKIPIFLLVHMDDLDKVKTIYPNIITAVSNYYQINKNNLTKIIEKYGYNTFKFLGNKNIVDLLELNEEDFNKIIKIFDTQKAHQLNMVDVDNIIGALLQREFRFSNKDVISIFPMLENLIEAKNVNEIGKILKMIQNNFNIDEILIKYNLNYNNFINGLIEGKTEYKNILHEITDKYISLKRDEYLLENSEKIKKELNLEKAYEMM